VRLTSLELRNVFSRVDDRYELTGSLIGIFGPNGVGKSTSFVEAPLACLTNRWRLPGGKDANIRELSPEKEPSYIRLKLTHNGRSGELTRGLRQKSTRLKLDGNEKDVAGDNQVNSEVFSWLGCDPALLSRYVFIQQDQLYGWLDDPPGVRSKTMAHLCGLEKAEEIYKQISDLLPAVRAAALPIDRASIDGKKSDLAEIDRRIDERRLQRREAAERLLTADESSGLQKLLEKRRVYLNHCVQLKEVREALEPQRAKLLELDAQVEEAQKAAALAESKFEAARTSLSDVASAKTLTARRDAYAAAALKLKQCAEQLARKRKDLETAEAEVCKAEADLDAAPDVQASAPELATTLATLQAEAGEIRRLLDELKSGSATCRACGSELRFTEEQKQERVDRLKTVLTATTRIKSNLTAIKQAGDLLLTCRREAQAARSDVQQLVERVKMLEGDMPEPVDEAEVAVATKAAASVEQLRKELMSRRQSLEIVDRERSQLAGRIQQLETTDAKLTPLVASGKVGKEEATKAQAVVDDHHRAQVEVAAAEAAIAEAEESAKTLRDDVATLEALEAKAARATAFQADLEAIRAEYHHEEAPKAVTAKRLRRLEDGANDLLERFGGEFFVEAAEDLSFNVRFSADGKVQPAGRLSGGQKTVFAICFHIARHRLFASELSLLELDEPTANLDEANREYLRNVLTTLGDVVRERDMQLIVVTHDPLLEPVFDQVIRVGAPLG